MRKNKLNMKIFYDKDYEMVCGENVIEWNFL